MYIWLAVIRLREFLCCTVPVENLNILYRTKFSSTSLIVTTFYHIQLKLFQQVHNDDGEKREERDSCNDNMIIVISKYMTLIRLLVKRFFYFLFFAANYI